MNRFFEQTDTLYDITKRYPETIAVFVSSGFPQMEQPAKRKTFGKTVTLKSALALRKLNIATFSELLIEAIRQERDMADQSLRSSDKRTAEDAIRIEGLLPCPVRIPMLEQLDRFIKQRETEMEGQVVTNLKAASMGLDWIKEKIEKETNPDRLPDLLLSAGFDLFFDDKLMGKFKKKNVFADETGLGHLNRDFDNSLLSLRDPRKHYSIIATVPAVFLVNKAELKGREIPKTWSDILKKEFRASVSLPIGDFDLFNAILLNIHKSFGEDGLTRMGESLMLSMHPSEMVKSDRKKSDRPAVTIMPYFFTKMVRPGGIMEAIWPKDGAIISPIFMLTKRDKRDRLKGLIDFFASVEVGELLAHKGLFPSTIPGVDNRLGPDKPFRWIGWDYIYQHNIGELIESCHLIFNRSLSEEKLVGTDFKMEKEN